MTLPVGNAIDHLFESMLAEALPPDQQSALIDTLGAIAVSYPSVWSERLRVKLSELRPSSNQREWIKMLMHMSSSHPFPQVDDKEIESVVEQCLTSVYSVDERVREAGLVGLRSISGNNFSLVLNKVAFSLKIYTINEQVIDLIDFLIISSTDVEQTRKILHVIYMLFIEEGAVRPDLLGDLAACVASATHPSRSSLVKAHLLDPLTQLAEILIPMSWRQDLVLSASTSLFGIYKAVCSLTAITGAPRSTIDAIQSGILRLLVHAKTSKELITVLESANILILSGNLISGSSEDETTTNACIPILIDIGIALGPLSLLGPVDTSRTVQRALFTVWRDMSARGTGFVLDRACHASHLSIVDRVVTLVYLNWTMSGSISLTSPIRVDSVVGCIDSLCITGKMTKDEPFIAICVLDLIASAVKCHSGFLLTVPIIDYVIAWSILKDATSDPSSIRTYWFSSATPDSSSSLEGPSRKVVQDRAQTVLVLLAESANRDSIPALRERLMEAFENLPIIGLESIVRSLVRIQDLKTSITPELVAWTALHSQSGDLLSQLTRLALPVTRDLSNDTADFLDLLSLVQRPSPFTESLFECLLSKKFFEKTDRPSRALILATELLPQVPEGCAGRTLINCLQKCDQEILIASETDPDFVALFGSLVGRISFTEYVHLVREMVAFLQKSKNRLIVMIGLKRNTHELITCIVRTSLGISAGRLDQKISDLVPVMHDLYLEPCFETIKQLTSGQSQQPGPTTPSQPLVTYTLEAIGRIVRAVSPVLAQVDGGQFVNQLIAAILPIVISAGGKKNLPIHVRLAMEAVTALALVPNVTLTTANFDHAMQFSVSVLVHGITSFSTIETNEYTDRTVSVSNLLVSILGHSFNIWLGLSRLTQLVHVAGLSSPLPIIRALSMEVLATVIDKTVKNSLFDTKKSAPIEWIETFVPIVPRIRDTITTAMAEKTVKVLLNARNINTDNTSVLTDPSVVPDNTVLATVHLLLHTAATDCDHQSSVYTLSLLQELILKRGPTCISPAESPELVSLMFGHSEKQVALQPDILECVHALSSIHLAASLTEILAEAVRTKPHIAFSDSQVGAIQSLVKEKKLLVGFVSFMTDIINNAEPMNDGTVARESIAAAIALEIGLSVPDSLIPAMVSRFAAPLFGTGIVFMSVVRKGKNFSSLAITVLKRLNVDAPSDKVDLDSLLTMFVNAVEETHVVSLAEFLTPFMTRDDRGLASIMAQKTAAEKLLCMLVANTSKFGSTQAVERVKTAFRAVRSVEGLKEVLSSRKHIFGIEDIDLVIDELGAQGTDLKKISHCLDVLTMACQIASKPNGDEIWRAKLLGTGGIVATVVTDKLSSDDVATNLSVLKQSLNLVSNLCDVAAFAADTKELRADVERNLYAEIRVRSHVLEDMGDNTDPQLAEKTLMKLNKICPEKVFSITDFDQILSTYLNSKSVEFLSMSSPSRSPLVVKGAAFLAIEIANESKDPVNRARIVHTLLRFIKTRKKSFLYDAAKEHVITAIGDLKFETK